MGVSETSFNRKKINYIARKRTNDKQRKQDRPTNTIDSKKARQNKLLARKIAKKEEKKQAKLAAKEAKMETD